MQTAAAAIITPIIHLNGDTRETLMGQLEAAYKAVRQAIRALEACSPHGRNYYLEEGRLQKAQAQHQARMDALRAVLQSLQAEAIAMQDDAE